MYDAMFQHLEDLSNSVYHSKLLLIDVPKSCMGKKCFQSARETSGFLYSIA